jgi:hypothetical protein
MLTENQISHFNVFGFLILKGLLTQDEVDLANEEFDTGLALAETHSERRGIRQQLNWTNLGPDSPFLGSLLEDARFLGNASQLIGSDVVGHYANCNLFDGDRTEWHPDTPHLARRGVKLAFYLQPLDADSGALRLIPGSHRDPFHSDIRKVSLKESNSGQIDADGLDIEEIPAYVATCEPGDVIAFDNRTWHASWGGKPNRRMCSTGYFAVPTSEADSDIVKQIAEDDAHLQDAFPMQRRNEHWVANEDESLVRQRWIEILREYGFRGL